jgi:Fe-S-cluster-containing hydrogenase component 2
VTGPSSELTRAGIPEASDISSILPDAERLRRGPVAIIECFQNIPCDPCADACRQGAILPFANVSDLPQVDPGACNGCALCIVRCPGLAIFVIDVSGPGDTGTVKLPSEYLPLPRRGDKVTAVDRHGRPVSEGRILAAQRPAAFDRTALITVEVPKEHALQVRGIRIGGGGNA